MVTKYGIKLTVIDECDYNALDEIVKAVIKLGYSVRCVDNGNFVCEKEDFVKCVEDAVEDLK